MKINVYFWALPESALLLAPGWMGNSYRFSPSLASIRYICKKWLRHAEFTESSFQLITNISSTSPGTLNPSWLAGSKCPATSPAPHLNLFSYSHWTYRNIPDRASWLDTGSCWEPHRLQQPLHQVQGLEQVQRFLKQQALPRRRWSRSLGWLQDSC